MQSLACQLHTAGHWFGGARLLLAIVVLGLCGCSVEELPDDYGGHRQTGEYGSVNGTDALAGMFTAAGHKVYFRRTLVTSEMEAADVVVWIPDDQGAPRDEVCEWFDNWLAEQPDRVLIYVGRHFNAAPLYWKFHNDQQAKEKARQKAAGKQAQIDSPISTPGTLTLLQEAPDGEVTTLPGGEEFGEAIEASPNEESDEVGDENAEMPADEDPVSTSGKDADESADEESTEESSDENAEEERDERKSLWFDYVTKPFLEVKQLDGPWAEGIDVAKTQIELSTRLVPHEDVEKLLWSKDDVDNLIVSRWRSEYWDGSQVIFVVNGSFTLNLPLVSHENRKLAARLVAEAGEERNVVFLESGRGGPAIDPPPVDSSIWTLFEAWPLGPILLQLAVVGILFGFVRWPIFGRPRQPPPPVTSDFSEHVAAVGQLIARTKDPVPPLAPIDPPLPQGR